MQASVIPISSMSSFEDSNGRVIVIMPRRYEDPPCFTVSISNLDRVEEIFLRVRSDAHIVSCDESHYLLFTSLVHSNGSYWGQVPYAISLNSSSVSGWLNPTQSVPMEIY